MESSTKRNQKVKSIAITTVIGCVIGALFTIVAFGFDEARVLKGIIAGFLITASIGYLEFFVFQNKFKKLKFSVALLIRTFCYVAAISISVIFVWVVHESSINNASIFETLASSDFQYFMTKGDFKKILIFAVVVGFLINLFAQVNSLLGKRVLLNYATGKYHNPKQEQRAFMFLDLSSSTTIAESLGPVPFHKFINNYFFDIDEAIVESKGEIYQYVGDEVVISWKDDTGFKNANCIKCFFDIRDRIDAIAEKYKNTFGIVPGFKAGLHWGEVVTGEIGDSKKEIVFHGDVLNTASRIQAECNKLGKKFLISEDVLNKIELPEEFKAEKMGCFILRGKENETALYSIERQ